MDTPEARDAAPSGCMDGGLPGGAAVSGPTSGGAGPRLKRGRLLVGVAALVAGALAKASERVASAADGDPLVLGRTNTAMNQTVLEPGASTGDGGLSVTSRRDGVVGRSNGGGIGVFGRSFGGRFGAGVFGFGDGTGVVGSGGRLGAGVFGSGGIGVVGSGPHGDGVFGSGGATGVFGGGGLTGVRGLALRDDGIGVHGQADRGLSAKGVVGVSRDGFAGYFAGRVYATNSVTTEGTLSVAAGHPDGTRRRLHSLASPSSYFQDFGKATLVRGRASVPLDPDFAALVQTDDYLVFLTPEARTGGLFVFRKTPTGFEVRDRDGDDDQAGDGTERPGVPFTWQVVARRRDTTGAAARLEPLAAPTPVLELPPMPELPELPQAAA